MLPQYELNESEGGLVWIIRKFSTTHFRGASRVQKKVDEAFSIFIWASGITKKNHILYLGLAELPYQNVKLSLH